MRVVFIVSAFPKLSESFIVNKFTGLIENGWDVHIVTQEHDSSIWQDFAILKQHPEWSKRIWQTPITRPRWLFLLLFPLFFLGCWLRRPLGSWHYIQQGWRQLGWRIFYTFYLDIPLILLQPTIVHFEFGALAPEKMYLKHCLSCQLTVSFRGYDLNQVGLEASNHYQAVWHEVTALHLLGENLWQLAQHRGCPPEKKHTLIPPAVDLNYFQSSSPSSQTDTNTLRPLRILSVGRMDWKKGYEYGLKAITLLQQQGIACEYRVIGDGSFWEPVTFACHQFQVQDVIQLLGAQTQEQVKRHMEWADVFLHSAVSEGFCNAVLEAQAMALPVVCTDAGGLPENVSHNVTGFVVPRRNPVALAEKLASLAQDSVLRDQMGKAGRQRVIDQFQLSDQIDAFAAFYQDVLNHA